MKLLIFFIVIQLATAYNPWCKFQACLQSIRNYFSNENQGLWASDLSDIIDQELSLKFPELKIDELTSEEKEALLFFAFTSNQDDHIAIYNELPDGNLKRFLRGYLSNNLQTDLRITDVLTKTECFDRLAESSIKFPEVNINELNADERRNSLVAFLMFSLNSNENNQISMFNKLDEGNLKNGLKKHLINKFETELGIDFILTRQDCFDRLVDSNDILTAEKLIFLGCKVEALIRNHGTPLHRILNPVNHVRQDMQLIGFLFSKVSNVNEVDDKGMTYLHYAFWRGNEELVHLLTLKGANMYALDKWDRMPVSLAQTYLKNETKEKFIKIFKDFIKKDLGIKNTLTKELCFRRLVNSVDVSTVEKLLYLGCKVESLAEYQGTPLHRVLGQIVDLTNAEHRKFSNYKTEVIEALLKEVANVNEIDHTYRDMTYLHYASFIGNTELVHLLLKKGANIDVKDRIGLTPLHVASMNTNVEIIGLLVRNGANVNAKTNYGDSVVDYAERFIKDEVTKARVVYFLKQNIEKVQII